MLDRHATAARPWLDGLPTLIAALAARWGLSGMAVLDAGGTSVVLHAVRDDGTRTVLKIVPDPEIARMEAVALRAWAGARCAVDLLAEDTTAGALLLAAVEPGDRLSDRPGDPMGWDGVAGLLAGLAADIPAEPLPPLAGRIDAGFALWTRRYANLEPAPRMLDAATVARCRRRAARLATLGPTMLLHGDLHPGNVLDGGPARGPVAIDPRPCLGDPAFDGIDWVLDRVDPDDPGGSVDERAAALAARVPLIDAARLVAWCHATAVMGAISALQSGAVERAAPLAALAGRGP